MKRGLWRGYKHARRMQRKLKQYTLAYAEAGGLAARPVEAGEGYRRNERKPCWR